MNKICSKWLITLPLLLISVVAVAAVDAAEVLDFTATWQGITSLVLFVFTYALIVSEETIHLRKSKPAIVAAGISCSAEKDCFPAIRPVRGWYDDYRIRPVFHSAPVTHQFRRHPVPLVGDIKDCRVKHPANRGFHQASKESPNPVNKVRYRCHQ